MRLFNAVTGADTTVVIPPHRAKAAYSVFDFFFAGAFAAGLFVAGFAELAFVLACFPGW